MWVSMTRSVALVTLPFLVLACAEPETTGAAPGASSAGGKADDPDAQAPEPVVGVADLHLHMFGEHAFGGAWLHGTHDGDAWRRAGRL